MKKQHRREVYTSCKSRSWGRSDHKFRRSRNSFLTLLGMESRLTRICPYSDYTNHLATLIALWIGHHASRWISTRPSSRCPQEPGLPLPKPQLKEQRRFQSIRSGLLVFAFLWPASFPNRAWFRIPAIPDPSSSR
jgi:hypothetical protein